MSEPNSPHRPGDGARARRLRAAAMPPEERRQAIVAALVPLLVERGGDLSTSEIAEAAGVAEGTIFRVFADKRALMLAAAREAINPPGGQLLFDEVSASDSTLREKIVLVARHVQDRMHLTISVLVAVRSELMSATGEAAPGGQRRHGGPPDFILAAQERLHRTLTRILEPHRDELAVSPEAAAVALRSLILGSARPELGTAAALTAEQIADLVLYGIHERG